jgi:DNA-binding response OmpR family regulator
MSKVVLIVEDEAQIRNILVRQLEMSGYTARGVETGEEALATVLKDPPDIVLLDVGLPGIDGFETLSRLRANPATKDIAVVMLTGQDADDSVMRGYSEGCAYYVPKPYRLTELLRGLDIAAG